MITVHVWLIPTDQPAPVLAELSALLDDDERRRAVTHRTALQRARFVAAHGAARLIVAGQLGLEPGFAWRRGEHGKPEPDVEQPADAARISVSHSADVALVAVTEPGSDQPRDVGIDIEQLIADHDAIRLAARFFPPDQAAYVAAEREHGVPADRFATLWCRKEACVKALGGRLVQGLGLPARGQAPLVIRHEEYDDSYHVCDVPAPRNFRAAVALKGAAAYRLRYHLWSAESAVPPLYRSSDHDLSDIRGWR